ncbi:nucleotide exchange factor GrpE [Opitutaceae bacterium TAV4]|uniref:nucleotide exchange factor GrpE n=1 Tax=Geminisphaera colitermitum TaxID=1148786 RepID=UPI000158D604|nr:nucleotide exchange factor GrpE [Geminisphaera colitermitum]RRJ94943.1 nucleotide exchange factor GrpE [Opitutaceae bacterium TAV4]RRJ98777.1 nucleotide exchange factor GrpE [Opitutaceae bacterium TAV3]
MSKESAETPQPVQPEPSTTVESVPAAAPAAPAPAAAADAAAPAAGLEAQLATAKQEAAANYDRYMRALADLENFRRRTIREKDELRQFAAARVIEDLLPVIDNLGFGLAAAKLPTASTESVASGIVLVVDQFKNALGNHGLKEINPAVGDGFDPNQEEAVSHLPSPDVPEGKVLNVVRIGYSLNGRLLRPATVVVSSGPATPAPVPAPASATSGAANDDPPVI